MVRKAKNTSEKPIITEHEAQRAAHRIAEQITKDVLATHGFSVSKLARKDKKEFKKKFTRFVMDEVVKDKYVIKNATKVSRKHSAKSR